MNHISARVIADSLSPAGIRLTTLELTYPRFIHSEFMTHRVFSRNASSSRAIPVARMLEQVRDNPAMPVHWGKNQPGMQAREDHDARVSLAGLSEPVSVQDAWRAAAQAAAQVAQAMSDAGYHKQVVNRLLEPFQWMHTVVTATEWDNFFTLRAHPDAQPEIHVLALAMRDAMAQSVPVAKCHGEWHLPYVDPQELEPGGRIAQWVAQQSCSSAEGSDQERVVRAAVGCSTARCARVSFLKHDGQAPDVAEDLALRDRLVGSVPRHASPAEHQALAAVGIAHTWSGNLRGWLQHRKLLEHGDPI